MADVTVYFNPGCSKCRTLQGLLADHAVDASLVEYLDAPPTRDELLGLMERLAIDDPRLMMRAGEPIYTELGLAQAGPDELLAAISQHPVLLERPIVVRADRAVIARPPDRVFELLDSPPPETAG